MHIDSFIKLGALIQSTMTLSTRQSPGFVIMLNFQMSKYYCLLPCLSFAHFLKFQTADFYFDMQHFNSLLVLYIVHISCHDVVST